MICEIPMPDDPKLDSSVELLLKAQGGDADALNGLLARYIPRLERRARGKLPWGLRSMLETKDLVQDAMIKALPHVPVLEVRTDRALENYLMQAIRNRIIDLHKRSERRPKRQELPDDAKSSAPSPERAAIVAEARTHYERALATLKDSDRRVIEMKLEDNLSFKEIAIRLEKPTADAARMAYDRAYERLVGAISRCIE